MGAQALPDGTSRELDPVHDQLRRLLSFRALILAGLLLGLLGGGVFAVVSGESYAATSAVALRAPTTDPLGSPAKSVDIGSERETASSNSVARAVATSLRLGDDIASIQRGLQVSNPPNTLVLKFTYTADHPETAAKLANAFAKTYLDIKREQTESVIERMIRGYDDQLAELTRNQDTTAIVDLARRAAELRSLDPTAGFVIGTAVPPTTPTGLGIPLLVGLGGTIGLAIGLSGAWVRMILDPKVRTEADVAGTLRAPILGTLSASRRSSEALFPAGDAAEEYRSLAQRLFNDEQFGKRRRLLVTAPSGATDLPAIVAVNLAGYLAELGMKVVLVEGDLHNPVLVEWFRKTGWVHSDDVGGADQDANSWPRSAMRIETGESGSFTLIPGIWAKNAVRTLMSQRANWLFDRADDPDTCVIVYAPSVLAKADAAALAGRVDCVLMTCSMAETHRGHLGRAAEVISGSGGTILGAVLGKKRPIVRDLAHRRPVQAGPR